MAGLISAFVTQTFLCYTDDTASKMPKLGALALEGRGIWHSYNCNVCHQMYGFGGFLGPDLTNAHSRLTRQRMEDVLTEGSQQMPAFEMTSGQIDALSAFLEAIDRSGVGQARRRIPPDAARIAAVIDEHSKENPFAETAADGHRLFQSRCVSCHTLFRNTPLGPYLAPDLSDARERLALAEIDKVLAEGRPEKGMPAQALSEPDRHALAAYITWVNEHRDALRSTVDVDRGSDSLPWWEFR